MLIYPTNMLGSDSNTSYHQYVVLDISLGTINQNSFLELKKQC